MTMDQARHLIPLLDEWAARPAGEAAPAGLSGRILSAAESVLIDQAATPLPAEDWHRYLDLTGRPDFLKNLPDAGARERWAEIAFAAISLSRFTLADLFRQRLADCPGRAYLQEFRGDQPIHWTYARVWERIRAFAAVLHAEPRPRVTILADNSLAGACADLACLCFDVLDTPLDPRLDDRALEDILGRLGATVALADTTERCRRLEAAAARAGRRLRVLSLAEAGDPAAGSWEPLAAAAAALSPDEVAARLESRGRFDPDETATVLFTSGSTGRPKGVTFSIRNLVTKRFARAAALPAVGDGEVLLCYLPLYHTFGRFLELLGMLYWRGTYVRLDNPSFDTLRARLPAVRPTGMIGVPQRWAQLHAHCQRTIAPGQSREDLLEAVRAATGGRLRWGLSAAGWLDPEVFQFFQGCGIALCSGFGMTEATGGLTMTPPGEYEPGSVGVPLPGARVRLSPEGELQVAGPYIARYLDDVNLDDPAGQIREASEERWLSTGDLFHRRPGGHLEIVDRIKDIYKNKRGQTVAPHRVEQKFLGVPGVRRAFLVGDGREDNVLLVVPDRADPVAAALGSDEALLDYCRQLAAAANRALAPPERVVEVALLPRDFEEARGELTPKGSYRRKAIEANFADVIARLYRGQPEVQIPGGPRVRVPRWLLRDLGLLESDVSPGPLGVRLGGAELRIGPGSAPGRLRIGDLTYRLDAEVADLGTLAQQPRLWLGNALLAAALPCRPGWDRPLAPYGEDVGLLPPGETADWRLPPRPDFLADSGLAGLHALLARTLLGSLEDTLAALEALAEQLADGSAAAAAAIRQRLAALARHPVERVRCTAYRVLLLDEPRPDHDRVFPTFVEAGLSFLDEQSIGELALADLGRRRLESLRLRLRHYRQQIGRPTQPVTRRQFETVFRLLADFARRHPDNYYPVRAELAMWSLMEADPPLAAAAGRGLEALFSWFDGWLAEESRPLPAAEWASRRIFDDSIEPAEQARLDRVFAGTTFLAESLRLLFDLEAFDPAAVPPGGAWLSRLPAPPGGFRTYRLSLNLRSGSHFDLQVLLADDLADPAVQAVLWRLIAISGHPSGPPALPRFGCFRPELGAVSTADIAALSVWDRIRECASRHAAAPDAEAVDEWRILLIQALAAFFRGWDAGGGTLVPGAVTPANVAVPEADDREAVILSLQGWAPYRDTLSLVRPMFQNFFRRTAAHYPRCASRLEPRWILDAVMEGLDRPAAETFLAHFHADMAALNEGDPLLELRSGLDSFRARLAERYHVPLAVERAAAAYRDWRLHHPLARPEAHRDFLEQRMALHGLDRLPEQARYHLYRRTAFAGAPPPVAAAFDDLLAALFRQEGVPATLLPELAELQSLLTDPADREMFVRMVFPQPARPRQPLLLAPRELPGRPAALSSRIAARDGEEFTVREPSDLRELGRLLHLFLLEKYTREAAAVDRHLALLDAQGRLVGGLGCSAPLDGAVLLQDLAVAAPLRGRGLGAALLEDFCAREANAGVRLVRTPYHRHPFYERHGFRLDPGWGGLVRHLGVSGMPADGETGGRGDGGM